MKMATVSVILILASAICSAAARRNVCRDKYSSAVIETYTDKCGLFGWALYDCDKMRYVVQYHLLPEVECCPGWEKKSKEDKDCDLAICQGRRGAQAGTCPNGGTCVAPDTCWCPSGLKAPGCDDIDECNQDISVCEQICENTLGSYSCICSEGFVLGTDKRTCRPVCFGRTGDNAGTCLNNGVCVSPDLCDCPPGSRMKEDCSIMEELQSREENECQTGNGGCGQICEDTRDWFHCKCHDGFELQADRRTCRAVCHGRTGDLAGTCPSGGDCIQPNTCLCLSGFTGDQCSDIDECHVNNGGCGQLCDNTPGSYSCSCGAGFSLQPDGKACRAVKPCSDNNGGCDQICISEGNAPICKCEEGYTLMEDLQSCIDVDECIKDNGGCSHVCLNTPGTHQCDCPDDFVLGEDRKTCQDVCQRNPCRHGGVCSVMAGGGFRCDCSKTGFGGKICDLGDIKIPSLLHVRRGKLLKDVTITYNVREETFVWASSVPGVHIRPNPMRLLPTDTFVNVTILAENTGKFDVTFNTSSDKKATLELKVKDIFTLRGLKRKALPEACFYLEIWDHQFSSTKRWYRYTLPATLLCNLTTQEHEDTCRSVDDRSIKRAFFTFGIAFYVARGSHLPMSLDGVLLFQGSTLSSVLLPPSLSVENGTVQEHDLDSDCRELELSHQDKQDLRLSQSMLLTLIANLKKLIAYWYNIEPLPHVNSSQIPLFMGALKTGKQIGKDVLCRGLPTSPDTIYVIFLFTDEFYFDIVGQKLKFPAASRVTAYCLVTELVYSLTYSIQFNENNVDMMKNVGFAKTFLKEPKIQISLRGLGISDNLYFTQVFKDNDDNVFYNGAKLFTYPLPEKVQMYAVLRAEKEFVPEQEFDYKLYTEIGCFVDVNPDLFFTHFYVEARNTYIMLTHLELVFRITIMGQSFDIEFGEMLGHQGCIAALGGDDGERKDCGPSANPPGIFAKGFFYTHMFKDWPIISNLILSSTEGFYFFKVFDQTEDKSALWSWEKLRSTKSVLRQRISMFQKYLQKLTTTAWRNMNPHTLNAIASLRKALFAMETDAQKFQYMNVTTLYFANFTRSMSIHSRRVEDELLALEDVQHMHFDSAIKNKMPTVKRYMQILNGQIYTLVWELYEGSIPFYPSQVTWGIQGIVSVAVLGLSVTVKGVFTLADNSLSNCADDFEYYKHIGKNASKISGEISNLSPPAGLGIESIWRVLIPSVGTILEIAFSKSRPLFTAKLRVSVIFLAVSRQVTLYITNNEIVFATKVSIFKTVHASICLKANIPRNLASIALVISGKFAVSEDDTITDRIMNTVINLAHSEKKHALERINGAKEMYELSRRRYQNANVAFSRASKDVVVKTSWHMKALKDLESAQSAVKGLQIPVQNAQRDLNEMLKKVTKLCKVQECSTFVCSLKNAACTAMKLLATGSIYTAKGAIYAPLYTLLIAEETLSAAKTAVGHYKELLDIARVTEGKTSTLKQFWYLTVGSFEKTLKIINSLVARSIQFALVLLRQTIKTIIDLNNCGFTSEISKKTVFALKVFCDINFLQQGWKTFSFDLNVKDAIGSVWKAAKSIVLKITEMLFPQGRKRREAFYDDMESGIAFNSSTKMHVLPITWSFRCRIYKPPVDFLKSSALAWNNLVSEARSNVAQKQNELIKLEDDVNAHVNVTLADLDVDKELALKEFNLTIHDLEEILQTSAREMNTHLNATKELIRLRAHQVREQLDKFLTGSLVEDWIMFMDTQPYHGQCMTFPDCVLWSLGQLDSAMLSMDDELLGTMVDRLNQTRAQFHRLLFEPRQTTENLNFKLDSSLFSDLTRLMCTTPPMITENPSNVTTAVGTSVRMQCFAESQVPVVYYWYKGKVLLMFGENATELTLRNVTRDHEGLYYCVAGNHVGNVSSSPAELTTAVPPFIVTDPPSTTDMFVGEQVTLKAQVLGHPWPSLTWYGSELWSNEITSSSSISFTCYKNTQILYRYTAQNDYGVAESAEAILRVRVPIAACPSVTVLCDLHTYVNHTDKRFQDTEPESLPMADRLSSIFSKLLAQSDIKGMDILSLSNTNRSLAVRLRPKCHFCKAENLDEASETADGYRMALMNATEIIQRTCQWQEILFSQNGVIYALNASLSQQTSPLNYCPESTQYLEPKYCAMELPEFSLPAPSELQAFQIADSLLLKWAPPSYAEQFVKGYEVEIRNSGGDVAVVFNTSSRASHLTVDVGNCDRMCVIRVSSLTRSYRSQWTQLTYHRPSESQLSSRSTWTAVGISFCAIFLFLIPVLIFVVSRQKAKVHVAEVRDTSNQRGGDRKRKPTAGEVWKSDYYTSGCEPKRLGAFRPPAVVFPQSLGKLHGKEATILDKVFSRKTNVHCLANIKHQNLNSELSESHKGHHTKCSEGDVTVEEYHNDLPGEASFEQQWDLIRTGHVTFRSKHEEGSRPETKLWNCKAKSHAVCQEISEDDLKRFGNEDKLNPRNQTLSQHKRLLRDQTMLNEETFPQRQTMARDHKAFSKDQTLSQNQALSGDPTLPQDETLSQRQTVSAEGTSPGYQTLPAGDKALTPDVKASTQYQDLKPLSEEKLPDNQRLVRNKTLSQPQTLSQRRAAPQDQKLSTDLTLQDENRQLERMSQMDPTLSQHQTVSCEMMSEKDRTLSQHQTLSRVKISEKDRTLPQHQTLSHEKKSQEDPALSKHQTLSQERAFEQGLTLSHHQTLSKETTSQEDQEGHETTSQEDLSQHQTLSKETTSQEDQKGHETTSQEDLSQHQTLSKERASQEDLKRHEMTSQEDLTRSQQQTLLHERSSPQDRTLSQDQTATQKQTSLKDQMPPKHQCPIGADYCTVVNKSLSPTESSSEPLAPLVVFAEDVKRLDMASTEQKLLI